MRHPLTIFILLAGSAASSCGAGDSSTAPTSVSTVPASVSAASVSVAPTSLPEVTTPDTEGCTVPAGELNGDLTGEMAVVEIDVDGASLSGRCVGTSDGGAATVILESGMRGDRHQLDAVGDALAPRMRVCSYDRAGIGRSGAPTGAYARGLVDDLESFVDAAGAEPPLLLVVQSIGGTIVHRFAQRNPGDVMGFVSMNPVRRSRRGSSGHRPSRPRTSCSRTSFFTRAATRRASTCATPN
ncbi:MAG: alpha/beta fold hydrolase [Ilumatobacteraceae bacterium]